MIDRTTDQRIAKIVGWGHVLDPLGTLTGQEIDVGPEWLSGIPHYSTDLAAAWTLVEHMVANGWMVAICEQWECTFSRRGGRHGTAQADTAAAAIAQAFLLASSRAGEGT